MATKAKMYVEEFLFRGRSTGDERPTGWHVILGIEGTDPLGRAHPHLGPLNSEQAIERGWDIPDVLADIDAQMMEDLEIERAKTRDLEGKLEAANAEVARLTGVAS